MTPPLLESARAGSLRPRLYAILIVAAGAAVYLNSFSAPFLFDDDLHIVRNETIRKLFPLSGPLGAGPRPVVSLSLALNYALGGLSVFGYHLFNGIVHGAAALFLFGILRRTFRTDRLRKRYGGSASELAFVIALLWAIHPLQTQAVTYIIQRAESLTGLFTLATLYCVIRSAASPQPGAWAWAAWASCALGMGSKPVMATAPLVILWYDRVFLSSSWRSLFKQRGKSYAGLALSWGILAYLLGSHFDKFRINAGFWMAEETASPWRYAITQPAVILHYLRLSFWPKPLILDYGWPLVKGLAEAWGALLLLGGGSLLVLWIFRRRPEVGFLFGWFFGILAPSSSFIPIADVAFEHRMYLPLAAVVAGAVLAADGVRRLLGRKWPGLARWVAVGAAAASVTVLGSAAIQRNYDYATGSGVFLWAQTLRHRPSARAYSNLGTAWIGLGKPDHAIHLYRRGLRLDPNADVVQNNLALALRKRGRDAEALPVFARMLRDGRQDPGLFLEMGHAYRAMGRLPEAVETYSEAARWDPSLASIYLNRGLVFQMMNETHLARADYERTLLLSARDASAHNNLGTLLAHEGRWPEAERWFSRAVELNPRYPQARHNLAEARRILQAPPADPEAGRADPKK